MGVWEAAGQIYGEKAQRRGASKAADVAYYAGQQAREDLRPWREVGEQATYTLADLLGMEQEGRPKSAQFGALTSPYEFEADPGYLFRLAEGEKGLSRLQSARGDIFSGRGGKELGRYLQDYASGEYGKGYERDLAKKRTLYDMLAGLSSGGRGAGAQMGQFGMQTGREIGGAEWAKGVGRGDLYRNLGVIGEQSVQDAVRALMMAGGGG